MNPLIERLAPNQRAKEQDILNVKTVLNDLDYYNRPNVPITPYVDRDLFDGIKKEPRFKVEMWERTEKRFPSDKIHIDDTADAYRHALSSYIASIRFGERFAKDAGDINERDNLNDSQGARLMDVYNNAIGRELAKDHKNRLRKPEDVIDEALEKGLLQTKPFQIKVEKK